MHREAALAWACVFVLAAHASAGRMCMPCPLQTFRHDDAANTCVACSSGQYATEGSAQCSACLPGEDHCPWSSGLNTHFAAATCTDACDAQPRCAFAVYQPAPRNRCLTWTAAGLLRARAVADPAVATTFRRCFRPTTANASCAACPADMGAAYAHALTGMHGWAQIKHLPAGSAAWFAGGTFAGPAASGGVQLGSPADPSREWAVPFDAAAARFFLFVCRDSAHAAAAPDVWAVTAAGAAAGDVYRAAGHPAGLPGHLAPGSAQIPAYKIRSGALYAQTGEFSPQPFPAHHLLYAEGASEAMGGPPPVACAVYAKASADSAAGPECGAGYAAEVGPGAMRVALARVNRTRLANASAVPARFSHSLTLAPAAGGGGLDAVRLAPDTLFFAAQPLSYARAPFIAPGFGAQSALLAMRSTARDVLAGRDAFSAGVLHRNTHAGGACCPAGDEAFVPGEVRAHVHARPGPTTGDFTALALAVVPGYVGPAGAGFAQRIPPGVAGAPFVVDAALRLGGARGFARGHLLLFTTSAELGPAPADWRWIACAQQAGAGSSLHMCAEQPDPDGGERNRRNPLVLDGIVVPLGDAGDCCSPLRAAVPVAVAGAGASARVALLDRAAAARALWARGGGLHAQHTPLCLPGLAGLVFSTSSAAAAAVLPCRWPAGAESPFPAAPAAGGAAPGPWFFDRVFVVGKGWILLCVEELAGGAHYRVAEAARVAPARAAWNYNVPNDAFLFGNGTLLYAEAGPTGRCAGVESCPAAGAYEASPGALSWAPHNASRAAWLYVVFAAGESGACVAHGCDEGAAYAHPDLSAVQSKAAQTLLVFPGTRVGLRAGVSAAVGARRRLLARAALAPTRAAGAASPRRSARVASTPARASNAPRRALLAVAAAPGAARGIATREIVGLDSREQIARAVCSRGAACEMLAVSMRLAEDAYCLPESTLLQQTQAQLAPVMLRAGGGTVSSTRVTSVSRPDMQTVCDAAHAPARRLLRAPDTAEFSVVLGGTAGPMSISIDVSVMDAAGIRGIAPAQGGADDVRVRVRVCNGVVDCALPALPAAVAAAPPPPPARASGAAAPAAAAVALAGAASAATLGGNRSKASNKAPDGSDDAPAWVWLAVAGVGLCVPLAAVLCCIFARRKSRYSAVIDMLPPPDLGTRSMAPVEYTYPAYPDDYYPQRW